MDQPFQVLTAEECLEQMSAGRLPSQCDKLLSEDYESVEVEEIELDHYADNTYEYTVQLSLLSGDNVVETSVTGQIGIDGGKKIYNIYVKEEQGFIDSLAGEKDDQRFGLYPHGVTWYTDPATAIAVRRLIR